jgi:diguanylate cyclase (GGDEF)-like protein
MLEKCGERGRQLRQLQKDGGAKKTLGKNTHSKIESKVPKKKKRSSIELTTPKEQIVKAKKPRPETLKATLSANDPSSKALDLESQVHELREQVAELTADNEKWRALVGKDTLTGLFNKITLFRVVLPKALVKLETAGPFSFIAITLDEVAQANLDHGWFMGDRLIKLAVRRLAHFVGPDEELYRLDGTQFVITAKLDDNAGLVRATDIHQQLAQDRIDVDQITMPMRASIGVVTTKTMHGKDTLEMANAIYQGIVKVLYLARENGGNKVEFREISG